LNVLYYINYLIQTRHRENLNCTDKIGLTQRNKTKKH